MRLSGLLCWLLAGVCLVAGAGLAGHHPVSPMLALVLLCMASCLVAWQPRLWLWLVPACLPWLNFSPWTGWLMFEEFDILLLGALAGGYAQLAWNKPAGPKKLPRSAGHWLMVLVLASGVISLWRGLADAGGLSFDWFANYSDALNSWRIFKSLGFATLFLPLLRRELSQSTRLATTTLATGVVSGLAQVVLATLWERAAFPGLLDFSSPYRTVALFWEMHVGGAAIDTYLAMTAPFVVWALYATRQPALWASLAMLAFWGGYICLTTFARGVYLAVLAPLLLLAGLLWLQNQARRGRSAWQGLRQQMGAPGWRLKASVVLVLALVLEVVGVLEGGSFMSERLASAGQDLSSRMAHWKSGVGLLKHPSDWLLGKGLGRLPANYAAQVPFEEFPGDARHQQQTRDGQAEQQFVTLYGPKTQEELGGVFELTQRVALTEPEFHRVRLTVRVRQTTRMELFLCERHLLYDRACQAAFLLIQPAEGVDSFAWQPITVALQGPSLGSGRWFAPRLKMFSISVMDAGAQADVDNIVLTGRRPHNLLTNGDFSAGLARWFPAAQSYFVPWHLDNLVLELLVERGGLGLLACLLLIGYALWQLVLGRASLQPIAPYLAASLVAVLLVGLVSSVMDVPRVAFLLFLLVFLTISLSEMPQNAVG
ncbi:hypothetical protein [Rhodoferax sp. U11-2br]|uniref:hypothetical protein n=1 Tax=Rhodoferax sp. U11-2br TaxID=2838878 RepID=UPI001BEA214D|nr:hypothetical protein [Rhodoferax sp. U11-2br]MBT3068646.1 hypothetical protein [Rhodoferax sp. U11-2br]